MKVMENAVLIGLVLVVLGFLILVLGAKDVKFGVGGFVGPIPFGFANDPKFLAAIIILTLVLALLFFR